LTQERNKLRDQTTDLEGKTVHLEQNVETVTHERDELSEWQKKKSEEWRIERQGLLDQITKLQEILTDLKSKTDDSTSSLQKNNEKLRHERDELLKDTQKLEKDLEEMGTQFKRMNKKSR